MKGMNKDQWNRTVCAEITSHMHGQVIFHKGAKVTQQRKMKEEESLKNS